MPQPCSGIILAGGQNKRFGGQHKALAKVGDRPIIDWVIAAVKPHVDELLVVTNDPISFLPWDATIATDLFSTRSSLTGIHAGLYHARCDHALIVAADLPLIQSGLIRHLVMAIQPGDDVVMPKTADGFQPLCAVYAKRCLDNMANQLKLGRYRIQSAIRRRRTRIVSEKALRRVDPELVSFFNVNTASDRNQADAMLRMRCSDDSASKTGDVHG